MTRKMNPEIKTRWIEALRSGDYKQGKSILHNIYTDEFCCLGVLCDIVRDEVPGLEVEQHRASESFDGSEGYPPESVCNYVGIETGGGFRVHLKEEDNVQGLTSETVDVYYLNDALSWDFERIADSIERDL
jgi:hypothetical protein